MSAGVLNGCDIARFGVSRSNLISRHSSSYPTAISNAITKKGICFVMKYICRDSRIGEIPVDTAVGVKRTIGSTLKCEVHTNGRIL